MNYVLAIPATLMLFICVVNFLTIRNPGASSQIEEKLSVVIPLRNEANNVEQLIVMLKEQTNLRRVEYLLLNDNSEDRTLELLHKHADGLENFTVIDGAPLPTDWIGKTWALQQLFQAAQGEIIISLDADVRLTSDALSRAVALLKSSGLDFISPYPAQSAVTWSEKLIQPLLQWSWMSTVVLRIAETTSRPSMVVANGQFFLVHSDALQQIGGYELVRNKVLDDVCLGRELVAQGLHGCVANGADIATTRMYSSWKEIEAGYGKSLHSAFGSIIGLIVAIVFIFLTGIAPLIAGITGSTIGWYSFGAIMVTRIISSLKSRSNVLASIFHPISSALLIYLIIYSRLMRGQIQWKGRTL